MRRAFEDDVYGPFVRVGVKAKVEDAADDYPRLYADRESRKSAHDVLKDRFRGAWEAEFGVSVDGLFAFVQLLQNIAIERNKAIFRMRRSALVEALGEAIGNSLDRASEALSLFTLQPRVQWNAAPEGFRNRDWEPWRYRRRLSVLRRPLIQLEQATDPDIMIAPGLVLEGIAATITSFHEGDVHQADINSSEMEGWVGHINEKNGSEFANAVARRLNELGWRTKLEKQLTELLGRGKDSLFGELKKFGDVDVLAWRDGSPRVLAIECKDVQFQKTPGEVAEQLSDFRGELRPNGKPDLLRRHLNRLEVLNANAEVLSKTLKLGLPIQIEGHLVFRNPVPMKFAWDRMASRVRLSIFDELDRL